MKISELTDGKPFELDGRFLPTFVKYNNNIPIQQMLAQSAVDELGQKGIIEKFPLHPISRSISFEEFNKLPANINPTPLGKNLCTYYLSAYKPPKPTASIKAQ